MSPPPVATTRYHIGAKQLQSSIAAYAKRFDLLEVRLAAQGDVAPNVAAYRRWRKQVPPHFDFTVVVGPAASRLKPGKELDADVAWALEVGDALRARCMLIATPSDVTPTPVWRDRLAKLAERLRREATILVWEPSGVWEASEAAGVARQLDLVLSVDPSRDPVPEGPVAYGRLRALGETRSFGASALERVTQAIGVRRDAYVVIETTSALAECKRLRQVSTKPLGAEGGFGRVVRPRSMPMRVKDDEQE